MTDGWWRKDRRKGIFLGIAIVVVAAAGAVVHLLDESLRRTVDPPPSLAAHSAPVGNQVGERAPSFSLPTFTGEAIRLDDYLGRIVVLDFWASWCIPCRVAMPTLEALVRQYPEVVLIGVSLDRRASDATAYLSTRTSDVLTAIWGSWSDASAVAQRYGVGGIPRTFLIDRDGIIRFTGHPRSLSSSHIETLL